MLVDLLSAWGRQANVWILELFHYIFPEYPKVGIAVVIASAIIFAYYLMRGKPSSAAKMAFSSLVSFIILLFALHWIIKVYKVIL